MVDPKGNVIFKKPDVTSRFGIASADCPLATEIIEGEYQVRCAAGATTSNVTVTVEKYALPKFKVSVTLDKPFYAPGDQVRCRVQADYFFGKPVAGGDVEIDVRGTDVQRYSIATGEKKTNTHGKRRVRFPPAGPLRRPRTGQRSRRFLLVATVTDTAGQKYSTGVSRIVTADPISLEVIPEAGGLVWGVANRIYLLATYADGQPAQARLIIHGQAAEIETNSLGVASFELTPNEDEVGLTVKATDAAGRVGRVHVQLRCGATSDDFVMRPDKAIYAGGETMKLAMLGGGVEPVFVDLLKDGQTLITKQIDMQIAADSARSTSRRNCSAPSRSMPTGSAHMGCRCASRAWRTFGKPPTRLNATMDQPEYRPGDEGEDHADVDRSRWQSRAGRDRAQGRR